MANHGPTLTAGRFPRVVTVVKRADDEPAEPSTTAPVVQPEPSWAADQYLELPAVMEPNKPYPVGELIDTPFGSQQRFVISRRWFYKDKVTGEPVTINWPELYVALGRHGAVPDITDKRHYEGREAKWMGFLYPQPHAGPNMYRRSYGAGGNTGEPPRMVNPKTGNPLKVVGQLKGVYKDTIPCDARCFYAKGSNCECSCGGQNHGAGHDASPHATGGTRALTERGGPGSGHFSHEGRPGEVGGSQPGDQPPASEKGGTSSEAKAPAGGGEQGAKPAAGGEAQAPKPGMFVPGTEPAKGDTPEQRQEKLETLRWAGLADLPDALKEEGNRLNDKYEVELTGYERNVLAQYSVLHRALVENLVGKGASEEDAGQKATAILKENLPELSDTVVKTVRSLNTREANIQASHAKAKELGYENYYTNQYTGEPIEIVDPEDAVFTGREKAIFNLQLATAMEANKVMDPNDLTLGQMREAFAGTSLQDKINSLYPAEQAGKKVREFAAEDEKPKAEAVERGGPGSGHHGHAGRPGKQGGSLPSGGGASPLKRNVKMKLEREGYGVQFIDDNGDLKGTGWYRRLEAAQADMDEWMATGRYTPKPGMFHSGIPYKRIKVDSLELSRAQRNFLLREMGGSTEFDYPELWKQLQAGNTITGVEVLDDLYTHVEGVIDRVDFGDKDPQAYRDRAKARQIVEAMEKAPPAAADFHSAKMPAFSIEREEDNYWGAPTGFRIGDKRYGPDELGKMFSDQPDMPETDRELAIRQVAKKPTKKAVGDVLQWSTSRYNEYSKEQAVSIARKILAEGTERMVLTAGSYTPSTAMTGSDYLVNGPEGYIAVGSDGVKGFVEAKRYYFQKPKPGVAKSLVARYSRRLVGK